MFLKVWNKTQLEMRLDTGKTCFNMFMLTILFVADLRLVSDLENVSYNMILFYFVLYNFSEKASKIKKNLPLVLTNQLIY